MQKIDINFCEYFEQLQEAFNEVILDFIVQYQIPFCVFKLLVDNFLNKQERVNAAS